MTNKPASAICGCQSHRASLDALLSLPLSPVCHLTPAGTRVDVNNVKGGLPSFASEMFVGAPGIRPLDVRSAAAAPTIRRTSVRLRRSWTTLQVASPPDNDPAAARATMY